MISKILNFFKLISTNLIGLLVGLVVAMVVSIILQATIYKNSRVNGFIVAILCIVFGLCGVFVQNRFFSTAQASAPTPQEQIENIDKTISNGWTNTNGGFEFDEIIKAQSDDNCPERPDQLITLTCHDFGAYVCFSFKNGNVNENIIFLKTDNGLIVDGLLNVTGTFEKENWYFLGVKLDLNSFAWIDNRKNEIEFTRKTNILNGRSYSNLISCSSEKAEFVRILALSPYNYSNYSKANFTAMQYADELTGQNAVDHFIKFGDVELIGTNDTGMVKINSFYNYLYEQIKGESYGAKKIIDGTSALCLPIPEAEQQNYPIPLDKQADYGDKQYYGVYRTNIAVELEFLKGNSFLTKTEKMEDYIETTSKDEKTKHKVVVEEIKNNNNFAVLNLNFKNTNDSDISSINLLKNPIKIQLTCEELNVVKNVEVNSIQQLTNGITSILNKNVTWKFVIDSPELIFEEFIGTFKISENKNQIEFEYYYLQNFVLAHVGLNPVGTIDETSIDLQNNPVKIIFQNDNNTYQFEFKNNDDLHSLKSTLVEVGEYNYTILSKQLIFNVSGKIEITTTDRTMLFNYGLNLESEDLKFTLRVTSATGANNQFKLSSASSNVEIIRNHLSSAKTYKVNCYIYDLDGKMLENFTHTHSSSGTCSDNWTASNLIAGNKYIVQLSFVDSNDQTKTYLSDYQEFEFSANTSFTLTYTVQES